MALSPLQTSADHVPAEAILAALERVLQSEGLRKTPSLRHLLQYLVTKSLEGRAEQIKESVIAIDVFSRREDFDGRIDNIVRVQAHRLRKLLETYYSEQGANDPVRISVPRGSYVAQFELKGSQAVSTELPQLIVPAAEVKNPAPQPSPQVRKGLFSWWMAAPFLLGVTLTAAVFQFALPRRLATVEQAASSVSEIWHPVFGAGVKVIAAYANPAFLRVGRLPMLIQYNGPVSAPPGAVIQLGSDDPYLDTRILPKDQQLHFSESWTGTGEVLAVNRLTLVSASLGHAMSVTPSRLLSLNDVHGGNVIFVGSPSVNGALAQMALETRPFHSTRDGRIIVSKPRAGESASYSNEVNEVTREVVSAYAVFSVLPGLDPGRTMVSSAGISTMGTWAGIDFTTSAAGAEQLVRTLKAANGGDMPQHYQAIIRAHIIKGAASNPSLVAVRVVPDHD